MLGLALGPTISYALAAGAAGGTGASWWPVCTAGGWRPAAPASQDPNGLAVPHAQCPLCTLQAQALGMPPAHRLPQRLPPGLAEPAPAPAGRGLYQRPVWRCAPARAPPLAS